MSDAFVHKRLYTEHITRARTSGRYFVAFRDYVAAFGQELGFLLSDLINVGQMKHAQGEGWFFCTNDQLYQLTRWKAKQVQKCLKKGRSLKILETRNVGLPCRRQIRIDFLALEEAVDRVLAKESIGPSWPQNDPTDRPQNDPTTIKENTLAVFSELKEKELPLRPAAEDGSLSEAQIHSESGMPLFSEIERAREKELGSKFDRQMAKELRAALEGTDTVLYQWSVKKWADEFRLLRKEVPVSEIQTVLDWYTERLAAEQTKGLPSGLCNAKQFRKNWNWIKSSFEKWHKKNPQLEITPLTRGVVKTLLMQQWPKGSEAQLPQAVQVTLNSYISFLDKLQTLVIKFPATQVIKKGKKEIVSYNSKGKDIAAVVRHLPSPAHFIEQWFRTVHSSIVNWQEWSGDLMSMAWSGDVSHVKFDRFVTLFVGYGEWNTVKKEM